MEFLSALVGDEGEDNERRNAEESRALRRTIAALYGQLNERDAQQREMQRKLLGLEQTLGRGALQLRANYEAADAKATELGSLLRVAESRLEAASARVEELGLELGGERERAADAEVGVAESAFARVADATALALELDELEDELDEACDDVAATREALAAAEFAAAEMGERAADAQAEALCLVLEVERDEIEAEEVRAEAAVCMEALATELEAADDFAAEVHAAALDLRSRAKRKMAALDEKLRAQVREVEELRERADADATASDERVAAAQAQADVDAQVLAARMAVFESERTQRMKEFGEALEAHEADLANAQLATAEVARSFAPV
ncbi:hypothetical protein T492DRAFT_844834 [Pavlovales sp. CCMP2436]|nr:hypothetical protein T492DRAFT_844834 [Pavlovales sp. CCMP2436]